MKVKKLFRDYYQLLSKHRTVEIITVVGNHVYSGLISEIPAEVGNKQINSWSTKLSVRKDLIPKFVTKITKLQIFTLGYQ